MEEEATEATDHAETDVEETVARDAEDAEASAEEIAVAVVIDHKLQDKTSEFITHKVLSEAESENSVHLVVQ